jgi:CheY-like chemotaxis protein
VKPPVVLVVDDFADNREMYSEYLEHVGFRVLEARDGAEAIEIARSERPAVVLMDLSIPVIDGWEATRLLKADEATSQIVVIVLTGHAEPGSRARALAAGCDAFLTKPCFPVDVAREIQRCLAASGMTAARKS